MDSGVAFWAVRPQRVFLASKTQFIYPALALATFPQFATHLAINFGLGVEIVYKL